MDGRERDALVHRLCEQAEQQGITIIRDNNATHFEDRISKFMARIGRGDRMFVVLSDRYLKSPYCMSELFDLWRNFREADAEFMSRTRVFVLPSAKIGTAIERGHYSIYWREKFDEIDSFVKQHGPVALSDKDLADYRRMTLFVNHTANILTLINDAFRPLSFDKFLRDGFDDLPQVKH